jgi:hypothetical protein
MGRSLGWWSAIQETAGSLGNGELMHLQTDRAYEMVKQFIARQLKAKRLAA